MTTTLQITILIFLAGTAVLAHSGVEDNQVMARMNGMSALADDMKVIGETAKGATEFDADRVNAALARMSNEARRIPDLFEPKASDPKSEAKPAIWDDFATFADHADTLKTVTASLAGKVESKADLGPTIQPVGKACKFCHSTFKE